MLTPVLRATGWEYYSVDGRLLTRFWLAVTNAAAYPPEQFAAAPDLEPCGLNANASRTWVTVQSDTDSQGFCGLLSAADLQHIWIAAPRGTPPPTNVFVTLWDRRTGDRVQSNRVTLPWPDPSSS